MLFYDSSDPLVIRRDDHAINVSSLLHLIQSMDDERSAGDFEQKLAAESSGRKSSRNYR